MEKNKTLTVETMIRILKARFEQHMYRHQTITWDDVEKKLKKQEKKLEVLIKMEQTDGEPDVVGFNEKTKSFIFMDCSQQSPKARRSVCYDQAAWDSRKEFKPKAGNAVSLALAMGSTLLNEEQYMYLQSLQDVDTTTSSWLLTPASIRKLGGALFGDKRFGRAFIFHNGAESYYGERGFRTLIEI
jgi:hypothetical protein